MSAAAGASPTDRARATVLVRVPPDEAFALFTGRIDAWWRRGVRFRHGGASPGALIHLEPHVGGRLFESFADAGGGDDAERVVEVGRVLDWTPPRRLVFSWRNVQFAPGQSTTVEVLFEPAAGGAATQVSVEHRGWDGIPADHPVRHGEAPPAFLRTMGLWWGEQLASLRTAAQAGDAPRLREVAHSLKSASATLGATDFSELCRQLEMMGREGRLDGAPATVAALEQRFPAVREALNALPELRPIER